jgi:hypothetical protein
MAYQLTTPTLAYTAIVGADGDLQGVYPIGVKIHTDSNWKTVTEYASTSALATGLAGVYCDDLDAALSYHPDAVSIKSAVSSVVADPAVTTVVKNTVLKSVATASIPLAHTLAVGNHNSFGVDGLKEAILFIDFATASDITATQTLFETGSTNTATHVRITGGNLNVLVGNSATLVSKSTPIQPSQSYGLVVWVRPGIDVRVWLGHKLAEELLMTNDQCMSGANVNASWSGTGACGVGQVNGQAMSGGGTFLGTMNNVRVYVGSIPAAP